MAAPVVSPVRGCGPDADAHIPSAGRLLSLSLPGRGRLIANIVEHARSCDRTSRACGRGGVIPPFLWFRARPKPPRSGVLNQATLALVALNLEGYSTPQDPVPAAGLYRCQIRRQSPSRPGASAVSHPDGNRVAVSFVRQDG